MWQENTAGIRVPVSTPIHEYPTHIAGYNSVNGAAQAIVQMGGAVLNGHSHIEIYQDVPKGVYKDDLDPYTVAKHMMPHMLWLYENGFLESLGYVLQRGDDTEKEDELAIRGKITLRGEEFIFYLIESEHSSFWDTLIKVLALTVEYRGELDEARRSDSEMRREFKRISDDNWHLRQEQASNRLKLKNLEQAEASRQTDLFRSSGLASAANKWN